MTQATRVARLSAGAHALVHACMLLLPAIVPAIAARFGQSRLAVDAVGTVHYLAFGLGAIPAGMLADRLGSRALLLTCLSGCALGAGLCAVAPSFTVFSIGLVTLGAAASLYHPAGLSMISRSTPSSSLGRALGLHGVGGNLGEALAPGAAVVLAAAAGPWLAFAVAALVCVGMTIVVATLPADRPASHRERAPLLSILSPTLGIVLVAAVASGFVYRGATYFLPLHLAEHVASSSPETLGGTVTSLALLAGVGAQWWGGRLADRVARERLFVLLMVLVVPVLLLLAWTRGMALVASALAFGFLWYLAQPLVNSIAASRVPRERHGALYGLTFTASFGVGSVAVTAGSLAAERLGTSGVFLCMGGVAMVSVLMGLLLVAGARGRS